MAEDQQLICGDCGQAFTFTAEDQEFFRERGYSAPKRCKACRQAKKNEQSGGGGGSHRSSTQSTVVTCSGCGQQTTVPFEPTGRPSGLLPDLLSKPEDQHGRRQPARLWQGPLDEGVCSFLRAVAFDSRKVTALGFCPAACAYFDSLTTPFREGGIERDVPIDRPSRA